MSAPKFTSGKWTAAAGVNQMVSGDTTVWAAPHANADGSRWFVFADADEHGDSEATARLIAAAPDGYALAEAIVALDSSPLQRDHVPPAIRDMARVLLAKVQP